jgi:hypothetical protein
MMSAVATGFERFPASRRALSAKGARRMLLRLLAAALDRLVPPPSAASRESDLPCEWFKYPPF